MDRFKYSAHLQIIESTNTKAELLKFMSEYSTFKHLNRFVITRSRETFTPQFIHRSKAQQIAGVLAYDLFYKAKQKYLSLGYKIEDLPKYAQQPTMSINIDETIKNIEDLPCTQHNK